ncbi:hypothetical protein AWM70_22370 [Paenibacillus yonginensis]|uniref:Uncharacterized protein n=1 Tax=Paenibacillus yonginensis TaxID=1462996 RepID=A0A1B1N6D0_9BACL|nr:hypothetical protein [Paenibacillus yonginensis]ANS76991.1 hypothetical protein AWM70_22370 [Paenibacillus yonginensis]
MKKTVYLAVLAAAAILTAAIAVGASSHSAPELETVTAPIQVTTSSDKGVMPPLAVDKTWSDVANNGTGTVVHSFSINPNYGHLKLTIENLSGHPVTVNLEHTLTDRQYFSITIAAHSSYTWKNFEQGYPQGMRTGDYKLTWNGGGYAVNGTVGGKLASQTTELP